MGRDQTRKGLILTEGALMFVIPSLWANEKFGEGRKQHLFNDGMTVLAVVWSLDCRGAKLMQRRPVRLLLAKFK